MLDWWDYWWADGKVVMLGERWVVELVDVLVDEMVESLAWKQVVA